MRSLITGVGMGIMFGLILAGLFELNPFTAFYVNLSMALIYFFSGFLTGIFTEGGDEVFAGFFTTCGIMLGSLLAGFSPNIIAAVPDVPGGDIRLTILMLSLPFLITCFGSTLGNYVSYIIEGVKPE